MLLYVNISIILHCTLSILSYIMLYHVVLFPSYITFHYVILYFYCMIFYQIIVCFIVLCYVHGAIYEGSPGQESSGPRCSRELPATLSEVYCAVLPAPREEKPTKKKPERDY